MDKSSNEYNDIRHLFASVTEEWTKEADSDSGVVIIYPPTIDWSWMKQRPQQLMESLSLNGLDVCYCNKSQSKTELYSQINPHLTIIHNHRYFLTHQIPEFKKKGKKIILWVSWSKLHSFLDAYRPDFIIYDYLDDFAAWKPYLRPMIEKADIIVTTSTLLREQINKEYPHKPHYFIPNGCDLPHFKTDVKMKKPQELISHKGPVITYSGAWAKWVDHELVYLIADTFKEAQVMIIGPEFGTTVNKNISNLKYLGYKSYNELPAYLQHSTVCLIPFLLDDITVATNPIKMYEYLASGAPVVSTDIPEVRNVPSVFIGQSHESFIEKIRLILDNKLSFNKDEVYRWLTAHSWDKRCTDIITLLGENRLIPT